MSQELVNTLHNCKSIHLLHAKVMPAWPFGCENRVTSDSKSFRDLAFRMNSQADEYPCNYRFMSWSHTSHNLERQNHVRIPLCTDTGRVEFHCFSFLLWNFHMVLKSYRDNIFYNYTESYYSLCATAQQKTWGSHNTKQINTNKMWQVHTYIMRSVHWLWNNMTIFKCTREMASSE